MKSKIASILRGISFILLLMCTKVDVAQAQCPMCRMSLESNLKNGGTQGKGINAGILYLLVTPYLIVGGIAFVWYRNRKQRLDMDIETELEQIA